MARAEFTVHIADVPTVRELIEASAELEALMSRSYEPMSMSQEYQRFHEALAKFQRPPT